jgi:hypothetical protein
MDENRLVEPQFGQSTHALGGVARRAAQMERLAVG